MPRIRPSGRQNIAEGSRASAASSQTELRLVNVARALEVRNVGRGLKDPSDQSDPTHPTDPPDQAATRIADDCRYARYARWLDHECPEIRVNAIICLIHQANYLLDRQIEALERQFVEGGGYSEQLATAHMAERAKQRQIQADPTDATDPTDPVPQCPRCQALMVLRTAKSGPNAGQQFWGCTRYPECKGTLKL